MANNFKHKDSPEELERRRINAQLQKKLFRGQSNLEFSKTNDIFRKCCEKANVEPTSRQASKFRNKTGKAYQEGRK